MTDESNEPSNESASENGEGTDVIRTDTAFVVYVQEDGAAIAVNDLNIVDHILTLRAADSNDMYRMSTEVAKDIQVSQAAQSAAQFTVAYMQQMGQAAAQAQQQAKDAQMGSALLNTQHPAHEGGLYRR